MYHAIWGTHYFVDGIFSQFNDKNSPFSLSDFFSVFVQHKEVSQQHFSIAIHIKQAVMASYFHFFAGAIKQKLFPPLLPFSRKR